MIKVLKAWLRKNQHSQEPHDYYAEIIEKGSMNAENIIDELLNEGLEINRASALNIISRFNQKTSDLLLSGYNVNTGLVKMRPIINGSLYAKRWNPNINSISVYITEGYDLLNTIAQTTVQLLTENAEVKDDKNRSLSENKLTEITLNSKKNTDQIISNQTIAVDNTACGIAFRNWLLKA
ncbi:MAG: DNA-binding domain-containing protein [Paludibacter sp.]